LDQVSQFVSQRGYNPINYDMRLLGRIGLIVVLIYAALVGAMALAMRQPPDKFGAVMAKLPTVAYPLLPFKPLWLWARSGKLQIGQYAPDFALSGVDGDQVRLSSFRSRKPVVLIFGSFT
jgi:hypothetical protein